MQEYRIAMLWIEGPLSYLEQLCIRSFLDAGHHVTLYHYGPVANVPEGVELRDGAEIMTLDSVVVHERSGSPAPSSDKFRYRLLARFDRTIWADTDAYCLRPFTTATGHFFGWESPTKIGNGVFALPRDSACLHALIELTADDYAIPEWFPEAERARLAQARAAGRGEHAGQQVWGAWGPHAVTHYLHKTGEVAHALPRAALFPINFRDRRRMLRPGFDERAHVTEATLSIHLYGRRMRQRLKIEPGGRPPPGSLLDRLLHRHGIDPAAAPLPGPRAQTGHEPTPPPPAAPQAPAGRGATQLRRQERDTNMDETRTRKRRLMLAELPKNGRGAEIGVWEGKFTDEILEVTQLSVLHLIDPWEYMPEFSNTGFGRKRNATRMAEMYEMGCAKFADEPRVRIHRATSEDALGALPDKSLDWVYIDGNHNEPFVSRDLALARRKVRDGGVIAGDDYFWNKEKGAPVKSAVDAAVADLGPDCQFERIGQQYIIRLAPAQG